jgi:hypothetical protein
MTTPNEILTPAAQDDACARVMGDGEQVAVVKNL